MKKIILTAIAILLTVSAFAQDGKAIYRKYSDKEGVSAVYISPAMFRLMGRLPDMNVNGTDIAPVVRKIQGFYLISTENPSVISSLKSDVDRFMDKGNYELLLEAKEDGENVRIYTVGDGNIVSSLVLIARDGEESTFICLDGEISQEELDMVLQSAM